EVTDIVRAAEAAAVAAGPAEDAQPLVAAAEVPSPVSADFTTEPATTAIDVFAALAPALGDRFGRSRAAGQLLYGFARHEVVSTYLGSTSGLRLRHDQPTGTFELNAKTADGLGSAWSGTATQDFRDVDPAGLHEQLMTRLDQGRKRLDLPAGRYEVVLPPSAVADLMVYLTWSAGARDAAEGRTVFSRPGGGTRIGERLSPLALTLRSDPAEPGLQAAPFVIAHASGDLQSAFDNGLPLSGTDWIRDGELANLVTTRHSAQLTGLPVRPAVDNLVLTGPTAQTGPTLDDLVAGTRRGLLLTCLWYIREVDPATLLLTGLTRDGVYLVEDGEIVASVNNFRFNESPVALLGRVTETGRTEGCLPREWSDWFTRAAMPAVRVGDFNMSSVSQAS
ncbi:MAG TPA: metallopeptidase TldD-related protein, partial [Kineosporiaceae bacterium]|nr:metallopeptidase TldD-related protein [Kineosporiaceae bacterium]